jgi:hypothetical protein
MSKRIVEISAVIVALLSRPLAQLKPPLKYWNE